MQARVPRRPLEGVLLVLLAAVVGRTSTGDLKPGFVTLT